jgi:flagellar basal-body rod modification protein FlgD
LQQTSAATSSLQFLGDNVTINSSTAALSNATSTPAAWTLSSSAAATGTVTITNSSGQVAYTGNIALTGSSQTFTWNGQGSNGVTWPDGNYTIAVTAQGANNQAVTVNTQVQGVVSSINASQSPVQVVVNGQSYPITSIVSINGAGSSAMNTLNTSINNLNSSIGSLSQLL